MADSQALDQYINNLFAQEDAALRHIKEETERHEMPTIHVQPHEGRLLQLLVYLTGARQVVEIGTLAGYSATWIARALPDDGKLYTLEKSGKHAQVARGSLENAGLNGKVELLEGDARASLEKLRGKGPFDMVFIDADKASYTHYLDWAIDNLRVGGLVAAHNAWWSGRVLNPESDDDHAMHNFNKALADHPQLQATILAVGDGMALAVKRE